VKLIRTPNKDSKVTVITSHTQQSISLTMTRNDAEYHRFQTAQFILMFT